MSFEQDWLARWREHQLSSGSSSESIPFLTANPRHSLGSKLIQALEQTQAPFVLLIEDLLVLDQSKIAPAISALKAEPDAIGAAIPVRYHYQGPKPHHYLSEDGHLLAACGVFHRERLLEVLAKSRVTGCDLQPVIDLSYLTLSAGEKLVPTTGHAERLPPRNLGYDWEVLPSNKNTWHLESSRDPIGPIPCLDPCNLHERQSIASIRKTGLHLYGQASLGYLSSNLLASLLQNLQVHSPFWRLTFNPNSPHSTRAQLSHNYPLLSQFFLCRSVLTLILDAWLATVTQRELTFHNNPIKFENDCPTVS